MTWQQAKQYCEDLGGHLVTITDNKEQSFIEKYSPWGDGEPNNSSNVVSNENCVAV